MSYFAVIREAGPAWTDGKGIGEQERPPARGRHGRLGVGAARAWLKARVEPLIGPLFCVVNGPTRGSSTRCTHARPDRLLHLLGTGLVTGS